MTKPTFTNVYVSRRQIYVTNKASARRDLMRRGQAVYDVVMADFQKKIDTARTWNRLTKKYGTYTVRTILGNITRGYYCEHARYLKPSFYDFSF